MFPSEIYLEILLRLPVKSTFVCKCVCKTWLSLISDPSFVKSHLNLTIQTNRPNLILKGTDETRSEDCEVIFFISHDLLDSLLSPDKEFLEYALEMDYPFKSGYDSVELMGCCDGVVCLWFCFSASDMNFLCLWNPATKEYKKLPKSPNADDFYDYNMIGLGNDSKSEDYKLVTQYTNVVEIYSLRLNSWTSIENMAYEFHSLNIVGVPVHRDLHWLAKSQDSEAIVCLDIGNQVFKEIQLPNEPLVRKNDKRKFMTVGVLEGCLCVVANVTNLHSEVWVMQDYGVQESWNKRYIITDERIMNDYLPHLMWSFKSGELLFGLCSSDDLIIYDPKDESAGEPNMPSLTELYQEGCYYESLVSLGSGTYVGGE
ncbi:F-box protein CPR1-like isoform X2 [Papaver somniferum]|uniref:F-box protein CPR1-like isoform X2 n=1 Tax=Papaver somniferum TaxID=3469 RepID=UPI000E701DE9|nr:F-box protein CPR1-like isoform X2 [Papaver somniferum]